MSTPLLPEARCQIFEKTRVGSRRTEVSVRLDGIVFCALSSGHGSRGPGFQGGLEKSGFS